MRILPAVLLLALLSGPMQAQCPGDCGGDGAVTVNDLVLAVSIALGSSPLLACPAADANGNGEVNVDDLVTAVNAALIGCPSGPTPTRTRTPSPTVTLPPTASPTPSATATPAVGPRVVFFGLASADDQLQPPSGEDPSGIPIFVRPFGLGFRLVVEAVRGPSLRPVGRDAFVEDGAPPLQIQVSRPLGNGSAAVCDGHTPLLGGVPGFDPPRFDDDPAVIDAFNDLGCRFVDGSGAPVARSCLSSCVRNINGDYACVDSATEAQFCALVDTPLTFPPGDTLVTVRVFDEVGAGVLVTAGEPRQIIVRIQP